jgi:hypothetical protein
MDTWTIIFITILAAAFGMAAWLDRKEKKRREVRGTACERRDQGKA